MPNPIPKASTTNELIALALRPSAAYEAAGILLRDTHESAAATKAVVSHALDELDIEVNIADGDHHVDYDASITSRSRRLAESSIGSMADAVHSCTNTFHRQTIKSLLEDLERTLLIAPQPWREVAVSQGVLGLWHETIANFKGLPDLMAWSLDKDKEWVEWFTQSLSPDFFRNPQRVGLALEGLDLPPGRSKKTKEHAAEVAQVWVKTLLESPSGHDHLNAIGVHERIKESSRRSLMLLEQNGWSPDPSACNWFTLLSLEAGTPYKSVPYDQEMKHFLNTHLETVASTWPQMAPALIKGEPPPRKSDPDNPFAGATLWQLLNDLPPSADRDRLFERLGSHVMTRDTPSVRHRHPNPRL